TQKQPGKMVKIFVTGGAGFIGSHLIDALLALGHQVKCYDDYSSGTPTNLPRDENLTLRGANIITKKTFDKFDGKKAIYKAPYLEREMSGYDIVYHLAAFVNVPLSIKHPEHTRRVNVTGTQKVIESARKNNIKRIVFASTAAVYGNHPELPKTEDSPTDPQSPYAETKLEAEKLIENSNLEYIILRFMNVYGPRQKHDSPYSGVISRFSELQRRGEQCTIYGEGNQTRDFVYVGDIVTALILAGQTENSNETYLVGSGKKTSINELYKTISKATGNNMEPNYAPKREGDVLHSWADITKAREMLGYEPQVTLEDGIQAVLEHKY
ncbi:NAD-dependent epimerase/dehydratase family protein, partial [Candidatus Woesearchaeota archaeon]